MPRQKMSREAAQQAVDTLNASLGAAPWQLGEDCIEKEFRFADFRAAFAFMTRLAADAERLDHHPDWQNCYASVRLRLSTHDAGGLTHLDFALAAAAEKAAAA